MVDGTAMFLLLALLPSALAQGPLYEAPGLYAATLDTSPIGLSASHTRFAPDTAIPCWCSPTSRGHPPLSDPEIVTYASTLASLGAATSGLQRAPVKRKLGRMQAELSKRFGMEGFTNIDAALRGGGKTTACFFDTASGRNLIPVNKVAGEWRFLTLRGCDLIEKYKADAKTLKAFSVPSPAPKVPKDVSNPMPEVIDAIPFPSPPPGAKVPPGARVGGPPAKPAKETVKKTAAPKADPLMPSSTPMGSKSPMPSATPVEREGAKKKRGGKHGGKHDGKRVGDGKRHAGGVLPEVSTEPSPAAIVSLASIPKGTPPTAPTPTAEAPAGPMTVDPSPPADVPIPSADALASSSPSALPSSPASPSPASNPANEGCVAIEHLASANGLQHSRNLWRTTLCADGFCATKNHALIVDGVWTSMGRLCGGEWRCTEEGRWVNNLKIAKGTRLQYDEHIVITPYDVRFPIAGIWFVQMAEDAFYLVGVTAAVAVIVSLALFAAVGGAEVPVDADAPAKFSVEPAESRTGARRERAKAQISRVFARRTVAAGC